MIKKIQGALSLDLLHRNYAPDEEQLYWANLGHCYVAAEAAYHLFARNKGYVPHVFSHGKGRGTHWWLVHEETGEILDPTEPQLDGRPFKYHLGRRATFLTKGPSKRARELMRRVRAR